MNVEQRNWTKANGWVEEAPGRLKGPCHLLLLYGAPSVLKEPRLLDELEKSIREPVFSVVPPPVRFPAHRFWMILWLPPPFISIGRRSGGKGWSEERGRKP
jgi:hypothetical protein